MSVFDPVSSFFRYEPRVF